MNIAAHQPNYLPWIGYFIKMLYADHFVFADNVQFTKHSYTCRVKIKTAEGKKWLTVPVLTKNMGLQKINQIKIDNSRNWRSKHWKTIYFNYKKAIFFDKYGDFFSKVYQQNWNYLIDLNAHLIYFIQNELNIPIHMSIFTDSHSERKIGSSQYIINMVKSVNGTTYISGQSGKKYLSETLFKDLGINLKYLTFDHPTYQQQFGNFIPNLSIIDLLFNEGPNSEKILQNIRVNIESCQNSDVKIEI